MARNADGHPAGRWRYGLWGGAGLLLIAPLAAMAFTPEMNWGGGDFAILAVMLGAACGAFELAVRISVSPARRAAVGAAIVLVFLLVWAQLAVGIV